MGDVHNLLARGHTPEWEFELKPCMPNDYSMRHYRQWSCKCGYKNSKIYKYDKDDYPYYGTREAADQSAWRDFMIHRYGDAWGESTKFDQVWAECFPSVKREKRTRKLVASTRAIPWHIKQGATNFNNWSDHHPVAAIMTLWVSLLVVLVGLFIGVAALAGGL